MEHYNYDERFCTLKMKTTTTPETCMRLWRQELQEDYKTYGFENMIVKFKFRHYYETHYKCKDEVSLDPDDHYILDEWLDEESCFEAALAFPLNAKTVEAYLSRAKLGEDWPTSKYVSDGTWKRVKEDVCEFILDNADFCSMFGFEMEATLDVSSVYDKSYCGD
ncbi:hypothetical protein RND81_03G205900 [Saponaria officinalis]|uniref:Uncharacterized protein n=1 Tax=Saponaria officinalis TaxID=3572 RepID=A0AAW1M9M9_SAPOF